MSFDSLGTGLGIYAVIILLVGLALGAWWF